MTTHNNSSTINKVALDGQSLTLSELRAISQRQLEVEISEAVYTKITLSNEILDERIQKGEIIYGVNTGFGKFSDTTIKPQDLKELQLNLLKSHACGVGEPIPRPLVRSMLALRINSLARGHSGVSINSLHTLVSALAHDCVPSVPSQGSVGASGDLCPLAHLVLPFTGTEGHLWNPSKQCYEPADHVMQEYGIEPLSLQRKEGLALINGTQFITANAAQALYTAKNAWRHSIIAAALSCEALQAVHTAFDERIHALRPHQGQIDTARTVRELLLSNDEPSALNTNMRTKVQDAYSIRCIPQILGPFVDISRLVEQILTTEINSVTDNPLIFPQDVLSGGNFHGQYPAKAADMLGLVIPDICNVSERRVARLVDASLSKLPGFLVPEEKGGLHSGMMIPAYTAAALCSETKCLAHPSSVDTIPTGANQEDHVSMGAYSARKALQAASNAEKIVAIELLVAAQGLDMLMMKYPGIQPSAQVMKIYEEVRKIVPVLTDDRNLSKDINVLVQLVRSGELAAGFSFPI